MSYVHTEMFNVEVCLVYFTDRCTQTWVTGKQTCDDNDNVDDDSVDDYDGGDDDDIKMIVMLMISTTMMVVTMTILR